MKKRIAQIHRFRDNVAFYAANGETIYVTAKQARAIAKALNRAAKSCERETFANSTCGTIEIEIGEN